MQGRAIPTVALTVYFPLFYTVGSAFTPHTAKKFKTLARSFDPWRNGAKAFKKVSSPCCNLLGLNPSRGPVQR
jgi:hypothetical protein